MTNPRIKTDFGLMSPSQLGITGGGGGASSTVLLDWTAPALTTGAPTPITTNTVADQVLLGGLTVTGAAAGDLLEVPFSFDAMNNSAAGVTTTWRIKIGGVAAWTSAVMTVGNNSTNRYMASGMLTILVATTTDLRMSFDLAYTVASGTERIKGWNTGFGMTGSGVSTESLATTKDIDISLQLGTASAAVEFRPIYAALRRTRA